MTRARATLGAALAYFGLVFGAGFALGVLRTLFVVPRLGARAAELLEMPLMLLVIVLAARWIVRHRVVAQRTGGAWWVGLLALALLLGAEIALAAGLRGLTPAQALFDRDPVAGIAYALALLAYAVMPALMASRAHRR
ncbi:MAG: hypothetical protein JNJ74_10695 [Xanthomonadales bacterium]|nr:hypothetical protein [Xanthomonadales bacterium]